MTDTPIMLDVASALDRLMEGVRCPRVQSCYGVYEAASDMFAARERMPPGMLPIAVMASVHVARVMSDDDWMRLLREVDGVLLGFGNSATLFFAIATRASMATQRAAFARATKAGAVPEVPPDELARMLLVELGQGASALPPERMSAMVASGMADEEFNLVRSDPTVVGVLCMTVPAEDGHMIEFHPVRRELLTHVEPGHA